MLLRLLSKHAPFESTACGTVTVFKTSRRCGLSMSEIGRDQVLPTLLNADHGRSRDEPEIAANIATQLEHMGLSTWSISVLRRLRDAIGRQEPHRVLEVGGSIGHRSAWLYDLFAERPVSRFDIIEQGRNLGSSSTVFKHDTTHHRGQTSLSMILRLYVLKKKHGN